MQGRDASAIVGDAFSFCVIRAWNLMDGCIDWSAIEAVAELIGIDDFEALIFGLGVIVDHNQQLREAEARQPRR